MPFIESSWNQFYLKVEKRKIAKYIIITYSPKMQADLCKIKGCPDGRAGQAHV
jgi:hypothetical protein